LQIRRVLVATLLALGAQLLILPQMLRADVIVVAPGDSINAAIERAGAGDTVLVKPGEYQEAVRLKGGVVLRGEHGPSFTHLIGMPDTPVVSVAGPGSRTLDGFTIDGAFEASAGVEVELMGDSALAITNSLVVANAGPGIEAYLWGSATRLAVARNLLAGNAGPGLFTEVDLGSVVIDGNEMAENGNGGCSIFAADGGNVLLTGNRVEANQAAAGGGMALRAVWGGSVRAIGNRLGWNQAGEGGGIYAVGVGGTLWLVNNDIHQNWASQYGGLAVSVRLQAELQCVQNTVADNEATDVGAMVDVSEDSLAGIGNNIFWGNAARDYAGPTSPHSVIGTGNNGGEGNLAVDPQFYNRDSGDYRLTILSPCVDQGAGDMLLDGVTTDAAGHPRLRGAAVDPGAFEFASGRQLIADLEASLTAFEEGGLVSSLTSRILWKRLAMADFYLRLPRGAEVWSLYYLHGFLDYVHDQMPTTITPTTADQLQSAALEIYDQVERWGG
jgi:Right handed beta helix region